MGLIVNIFRHKYFLALVLVSRFALSESSDDFTISFIMLYNLCFPIGCDKNHCCDSVGFFCVCNHRQIERSRGVHHSGGPFLHILFETFHRTPVVSSGIHAWRFISDITDVDASSGFSLAFIILNIFKFQITVVL